MTPHSVLPLACGVFIIGFKVLAIVYQLWDRPLNHGPAYFLGVAVPPGFYEGAGQTWLKRYRALVLAQFLLVCAVFAGVLLSGHWSQIPLMAPVDVISLFVLVGGAHLWVRRALGSSPPVLAKVAAPLEVRRPGQYISIYSEAIMFTIVAASWLLLLTGPAPFDWSQPVLTTYVVVGVLIGKLILARGSFPLPPDRTEEHHRWFEAYRRYSLRIMDLMCWLLVATLLGYAVMHGWAPAPAIPWLRPVFIAIGFSIGTAMCVVIIRGGRRIAEMGRELRPVGSWKSLFRPSPQLFVRGGLAWGITYCVGLVALLLWFR